jgi:pimeloyl-ACP methyl ester carboxylesterase
VRIVFLHAFPLDERMWEGQLDAFADYEVMTPNLYRLGRSMESRAEAVLESIQGPVAVCGASMGGYCALAIARRAPERLTALALLGARADADAAERRSARAGTIELICSEGPAGLWEDMRPKLFPDSAPERVVERAKQIALEQDPDELVAAVEAIRDRPDSSELVASLRIPVLIAVGEQDAFVSVEEARATAASARDGRLHVFEGAGHLASMDRPDEFNRVLEDFLA